VTEPGIGEDGPRALSCQTIESTIREVWSEFFGREVYPDDDFYDLGGDSVAIVETVHGARQRGLALRSSEALRNPTPARLAEYLTVGDGGRARPAPLAAVYGLLADRAAQAAGSGAAPSASYPLVASGEGVPLYVVHSDSHRQLELDAALEWDSPGPIRTFRFPEVAPGTETVARAADELVRVLRDEQAAGPYRLAGFGFGAVVAFEMGRRLERAGESVDFVALIGPPTMDPAGQPRKTVDDLLQERVSTLARRFALTGEESPAAVLAAMREAGWYDDTVTPEELSALQIGWARFASALADYEPAATDFPTVLIHDVMHATALDQGWKRALGDAKSLWLDHGTVSPRLVIQDPRSAAFLKEVLAS